MLGGVEINDLDRIDEALVTLMRRSRDPRGNQRINAIAGVEIERSGAVMLAHVEEHQPARLSALADAAGIEISTASRQVARLVDYGFVERGPDPDDRRASAHRLTAAGRDLRRRLVEARRTWLATLLSDFEPDERAQLAELLERFNARADDPTLAAAPLPSDLNRREPLAVADSVTSPGSDA